MRNSALVILIFILHSLFSSAFCQKPQTKAHSVPASFSVTLMEQKLYSMINEYRASFNLPPIPLSRSLSYVASTHVKDLSQNHPDQAPCNFHSWSNRGFWKPFCYPRDEKKNNSVWDKPKELTTYKGKGYEIIYWENNPVNIDSIIPFWSSIDYFNSFLLNTGKWQDKKWMAIGVGIFENYASAWFGELPETEEITTASSPVKKNEKIIDSVPNKETKADPKPKPEPKPEKKTLSSDPEQLPADVQPVSGTYYIVVSSQQPRAKSNQLANELIAKGYPQAKVLAKDNKVRVSIVEFSNKTMADSALREIKKIYKDAWIFKQ